MRTLFVTLLVAPAALAGQVEPRPLLATQVLHVAPDSARAFFGGNVLMDHRGVIYFERAAEPLPRTVVSTIIRVLPDGRLANVGSGDSSVQGTLQGWVGGPDLDSLWISSDTVLTVFKPNREVARTVRAPDLFGRLRGNAEWLSVGALALYSDGSTLYDLYHLLPQSVGVGGESAPGLLVRIDEQSRWRHVVAAHPWTDECHARDRTGKDVVILYCADSRIGVSPSGNQIAEAFVESGHHGFTVVSLSASGDTNFRKSFVTRTDPIPERAMRMITHTLDSILTPEARARVTVPTRRRDFNRVIATDDGVVWVELDTPDGIPHRWIEIDRRGKLVGQVVMPAQTHLTGGLADALWGMEQGGPRYGVVKYHVTKP